MSIAKKAHDLVYGDRGEAYGPPPEDYGRTVAIFEQLTNGRHKLTAAEGCLFMVAVKLSREAYKPSHDNRVDAIGYLDCYDQALEAEE